MLGYYQSISLNVGILCLIYNDHLYRRSVMSVELHIERIRVRPSNFPNNFVVHIFIQFYYREKINNFIKPSN